MFERVLDAIYLTSSQMVSCCRLNGFIEESDAIPFRCCFDARGNHYRSVAMTGPDILSIEGNDVQSYQVNHTPDHRKKFC